MCGDIVQPPSYLQDRLPPSSSIMCRGLPSDALVWFLRQNQRQVSIVSASAIRQGIFAAASMQAVGGIWQLRINMDQLHCAQQAPSIKHILGWFLSISASFERGRLMVCRGRQAGRPRGRRPARCRVQRLRRGWSSSSRRPWSPALCPSVRDAEAPRVGLSAPAAVLDLWVHELWAVFRGRRREPRRGCGPSPVVVIRLRPAPSREV